MRSSTPPKWSLHYQACRIERLQALTARMSRKDAMAQLASEEIGAPWRESQPLPPLTPCSLTPKFTGGLPSRATVG